MADLWADIFQNNSEALLSMLSGFESNIASLRTAIESNDRATLERILGQASEYRSHWKHH